MNQLMSAYFPLFHEYQALLLFYGKADVYARAQGRTPSQRWRQWVG